MCRRGLSAVDPEELITTLGPTAKARTSYFDPVASERTMAVTINTNQAIKNVNALILDLKTIKVSDKVLDVGMNQFAFSNAAPLHSSGYATCIGILTAVPGKGCLAHMDMTIPAFAGVKPPRWAETNIQIYKATIAQMVNTLGAAADLVLFASTYSRSGKDKSEDLMEEVVDWALDLYRQGKLTGVWDFRTHPESPRTDKLGTVVEKHSVEHFGRALYMPASNTIHLFQSAGGGDANAPYTWASIEKAERLLGWRPQVSFSEGLSRLVEWYMSNRNWASQIHT